MRRRPLPFRSLLLVLAGHLSLAAAPAWRLPDGTLTAPPPSASVPAGTAYSARIAPGTDGGPVFPVPFALAAGEVLSVSLRLEAATTAADTGAEGQAGLVLTLLPASSKTNYNPDAEHRQIVIIGTSAETIRFAFRTRADHAADALLLVPTLSYFGRTVLVADVTFTAHGVDADPQALTASTASYPGHAPDAAWRAEATARIDRHRKANLRVIVTDRLGQPLPDATITVDQLEHAYRFGTAVVSARLVDAPRAFPPDADITPERWLADNARYRAELRRNFNTAVTENDLKWPQWAYSNDSPGVYHQSWTLAALDWLHTHGFTTKGHTLVWGSWRFTPPWLRELEADPAAVQRAVLAHIRDVGGATADRTRYWDVLNEPMSHRAVIRLLGPDHVAAWFKEARSALPAARLVMNEFDLVGNGGNASRRADFLAFHRMLADHGAPIDVLGLQAHFWSERFTAPEDIWRIADELHAASGLPLMVSEFDTNVPNEQLQADYTRDFLTAWFAHPATEAFIMWGFWGGAHWMGDAGAMFRRDWTPKPNLEAYRALVYGDWWTRASLTADAAGAVTVRAFHGRHRVTVTAADGRTVIRELDLPAAGRDLFIIIPEPEPTVSPPS